MPSVIVAGGGLAGLSTAAALGSAGYDVDLYESRAFLGGRATSYEAPGACDQSETIDNCQHILLRCCVNLIDFYERLGVAADVHFYREFVFLEPGGRASTMRAGLLPAPLHFAGSFAGLKFLGLADKLAIARAMLAIRREHATRADLDQISMLAWLREKRQTERAIQRFWSQVLVSAINEDLHRIAARHGFQVFWLAFLARSDSWEMGVPIVPLGELYSSSAWERLGSVRLHLRAPVDRFVVEDGAVRCAVVGDSQRQADHYVSAVPFERLAALAPDVPVPPFTHSPITGIHLWFDRPITDLPNATLLDRTIQWMYNKSEGRYVQLVVSASRSLVDKPRTEVIALAVRELAEFFPAVREAQLVKAHVVKEVRATFSAAPGTESQRPTTRTAVSNLFLAGDWTRTGWPPIMESAVRSGYLAAEAITGRKFLLPDIA
ncbi:MAG TPA: hydroxysqualene dehydroxylase HpnE [Bryobacteraceae bacterium]|nr:hydroxysqualene dehydroxylase HpnE [Bryobacteraceae bacterium]